MTRPMRHLVDRFDPSVPIERAHTPPAAWYRDNQLYELERTAVFKPHWQLAGPLAWVDETGRYLTGEIVGEPFVVVRDDGGELRAFYNVCRHHAACLVSGEGRLDAFVCPYHGWTYDLDGRLRRAPRLGGVRDFDRSEYGLVPIEVEAVGPLVFVRLGASARSLADLLAPVGDRLRLEGLRFVRRLTYDLDCNWKVFVDNYLDGGYHVDHLHHGLAAQLALSDYRTELHDHLSVQSCGARGDDGAHGQDFAERLGERADYVWVHPNLMFNRYGAVLDTNWVIPLGPERTRTVFDYYFDEATAAAEPDFIERSLAASDQVQQEDIAICESVQRGLRSSAYDTGRYAPRLEQSAHQFHKLLAADLKRALAD